MSKIVIAELDIDVQAMIASTAQVKKVMDDLKKSQKELTDNGQGASKAFVENASNLKVLNAEYTAGVKALADNTKATADQANRTAMLDLALKGEVSSIAEARAQNTLLNKLRNETNVTTEEGKAQLTALNGKLDKNNEFIKENADAYLKQKINIGNYSDSIKDALNNLNPFNGGIAGFTQRAQEAGGAGNLMKSSVAGVTSGIGGMIKASLAFIATPIGAVIAVIAGVALILYNVFKSFQPVVDKVEQGFAALSAVINVVKNTILAVVTGASSLKDAFSGLGGSMSKAADEAMKLTKAQQDLDDALAHQEVSTARNRAEINKLNVQLKDRTKTEEERLKISDKIIEKENEDFQQRKKIADEEVRIARGNIALKAQFTDKEKKLLKEQGDATKELAESRGGNYDAEYEALNKARIKVIGLENEVSVNIEKQYVKRNKIEDDATAKREKAQSDAIAAQEKLTAARAKSIDDNIAKNEQEFALLQEKTRFEEDSLTKARTLADAEVGILKTKLANKRITETEYQTQKLKIENDLKEKQTVSEEAELERLKVFNDKKTELENQLELNKLTSQEEKDLLKATFDLEKHLAELENIKATETEKNELRKLIMLEYNDQVAAITDEAANIRLQKQGDANVKELEFERTKNDLKLQLAGQLGNTLLSILGDSLGAQLASIAFDAVLQIAKMRIATASAQQINLANATAMGAPPINIPFIAAAAAQNVALGASSKLNQAGVLASAAISGLGAVAKKFEKGGIQEVGGNRHAQGGTKFYGEDGTTFEAEQGEGIGVLNRGAFASFMDFNNSHGNGKSTPTFMAGGGIITQGVQSQSNGMNADDILNIIKSMPAPVVAVTDIHSASDNYARVVNGADF